MNVYSIKLFFLCIGIFGISVLLGAGFIYQHEQVHKAIYNNYDIESEIVFNYFSDSYTRPLGNYSKCDSSCQLAHGINEAVGFGVLIYYTASQYYFFKQWKEEMQE
jgi:hypothetical protein